MNRRYALTGAVVAALMLGGTSAALAATTDKDCGDFPSQAAAQAFFVANGPGDPHRLDRDNDGKACESHRYAPAGDADDDGQVETVPNTDKGVETGGL